MANQLFDTTFPFVCVFTDPEVNPSFPLTVNEALRHIDSKPVGHQLLASLSNSTVAALQGKWKVVILRPAVKGNPSNPGAEGGSRALGVDESLAKGGAGCQAKCVWNPNIYNTPNGSRPAFIGLAHELIHCFHMVTGVMKQGYDEEENFTVGLAPYDTAPITENTIRAEHGVAARTAY